MVGLTGVRRGFQAPKFYEPAQKYKIEAHIWGAGWRCSYSPPLKPCVRGSCRDRSEPDAAGRRRLARRAGGHSERRRPGSRRRSARYWPRTRCIKPPHSAPKLGTLDRRGYRAGSQRGSQYLYDSRLFESKAGTAGTGTGTGTGTVALSDAERGGAWTNGQCGVLEWWL